MDHDIWYGFLVLNKLSTRKSCFQFEYNNLNFCELRNNWIVSILLKPSLTKFRPKNPDAPVTKICISLLSKNSKLPPGEVVYYRRKLLIYQLFASKAFLTIAETFFWVITLFILLFRKENIFTDYIICTFAHFRQHEPQCTEVIAKGLLLQLVRIY